MYFINLNCLHALHMLYESLTKNQGKLSKYSSQITCCCEQHTHTHKLKIITLSKCKIYEVTNLSHRNVKKFVSTYINQACTPTMASAHAVTLRKKHSIVGGYREEAFTQNDFSKGQQPFFFAHRVCIDSALAFPSFS